MTVSCGPFAESLDLTVKAAGKHLIDCKQVSDMIYLVVGYMERKAVRLAGLNE